MKPRISELCRKNKDTMNPRRTNEELATRTGLRLNTVASFLRGEIANPGVYTVGLLCRETGVSLDDYFDIKTPSQTASEVARQLATEVELLKVKNEGLQHENTNLHVSLRMHRFTTGVLLGVVAAAVIALLIDALNPDAGWIRRALTRTQQIVQAARGAVL